MTDEEKLALVKSLCRKTSLLDDAVLLAFLSVAGKR